MRKTSWLILSLAFCLVAPAQETLPRWTAWSSTGPEMMTVGIPAQLKETPNAGSELRYLVLRLDPQWAPDWKSAAFDMKGLIVAIKSNSPKMLVGIEATESQIEGLLAHEMAAYFDGYLFDETPYLPEADETGKLWQKAKVSSEEVLGTLVDAASLGIELVLFEDFQLTASQRQLLVVVSQTQTGSLDLPPDVSGIPQEATTFFFDPTSGNYHLAVFVESGAKTRFTFPLSKGTKVRLLYPETASFEQLQFGKTTEINLGGESDAYFFELEPGEKAGTTESLEVRQDKIIDPYELVVKNQVFKQGQAERFTSLEVDEELNYRYQAAGGIDIDVTYMDRVIERAGQPIERIRKETYLAGVRWNSEKQPELPLISPEKVQTAPLVIDLDKTYVYTYRGEGEVDGHPTWRVKFAPKGEGDFFTGTVWIDKETGAHRKVRAVQSGLEAPVVGNEMTVYYDWVEYNGQKYWTQVREENLQLINIVGERLTLLINSTRKNYIFNSGQATDNLMEAYKSTATILRDTDKGFRYLKRAANGGREINNDPFFKKKAVLGGILVDPALDTPIPLAGFNYTNLDFMGKGYQANFFLAGAVNDLIVSNPDFLGKGWDLTGELFLTPLYFGDTVYENNEEREDLEVESLTESFNVTLGIPFLDFWKVSGNYALRYVDYKEADETSEDYVLPQGHLQHQGTLGLEYSRSRFVSELTYSTVKRSEWEAFGLPDDTDSVDDSFRTLRLDMGVSKRLPKFQNIGLEARYLKGWDLDRFSRFGFGFFDNRVPGFGTSGIRGDEAYRLKMEYEVGVKGLFNLDFELTGARAMLDKPVVVGGYSQPDEVDLAGIGVAVNVMGPWRTLVRLDMGYGAYSSLPSEEGDFSGQLVFLKLF